MDVRLFVITRRETSGVKWPCRMEWGNSRQELQAIEWNIKKGAKAGNNSDIHL